VEDVQPYTIPTLSKAKISHHLSYPVGATAISLALASAAQLPELKLHFYSGITQYPFVCQIDRAVVVRSQQLNVDPQAAFFLSFTRG
jgi:hypothetical protein